MVKEGKANAQVSKSQPLRVAQHESVHTLNAILQQSAFASVNSVLKGNLPPTSARKGCQYLQSLARKATLRLDVSVKRSICRRCHSFLLPGITCTTRIRPSKSFDLVLVRRCTICGASRRLPCPAVQSKRFKALSRRHEKRQSKIDSRKVSKKVESATQGTIKVNENGVMCSAKENHGKLSQRARRRAAQVLREEADKLPHTLSKRTRKRKRQKGPRISSAADGESSNKQSYESGVFIISQSNKKKAPKEASKKPPKKGGLCKLDLAPYHGRLQSTSFSETHWKCDIPSDMQDAQRQALSMLRGDHIVTVGLGKGGVVGDRA
jgi:RNase P subunit RPR2